MKTQEILKYYLDTRLEVVHSKKDKKGLKNVRRVLNNAILYQGIKPIFNPLSSLTKPITVEGYNDNKPFVPAIVLWRLGVEGSIDPLVKPEGGWYEGELKYSIEDRYGECRELFVYPENKVDRVRQNCLKISFNKGSINSYTNLNRTDEYDFIYSAFNQFEIIQYLIKWHFNIFELSPDSWIDKSTLK